MLQHPQHPYTKRLVAAAPSLASQRIISAKERGENADALLDHHIAGESTLEKSEHIITVDHLTKEFKLPRKKEMFKASTTCPSPSSAAPPWPSWANPVPASPPWRTWCFTS